MSQNFTSCKRVRENCKDCASDYLAAIIHIYTWLQKYWYILKSEVLYSYRGTVWLFQDYPVTQILSEINFGESRSCKTAGFVILGALKIINLVNFSLQKVQSF